MGKQKQIKILNKSDRPDNVVMREQERGTASGFFEKFFCLSAWKCTSYDQICIPL